MKTYIRPAVFPRSWQQIHGHFLTDADFQEALNESIRPADKAVGILSILVVVALLLLNDDSCVYTHLNTSTYPSSIATKNRLKISKGENRFNRYGWGNNYIHEKRNTFKTPEPCGLCVGRKQKLVDTLSKLKLITKIIREAREDLALDNLRAFAKEKLNETEEWRKKWQKS